MVKYSHDACTIVAAIKWTYNEGLLLVINADHKLFGLPIVLKLDNTIVRIIVAMHDHKFASGCDYRDEFKKNLNRTIGNKNTMKLHEEKINSHE